MLSNTELSYTNMLLAFNRLIIIQKSVVLLPHPPCSPQYHFLTHVVHILVYIKIILQYDFKLRYYKWKQMAQ